MLTFIPTVVAYSRLAIFLCLNTLFRAVLIFYTKYKHLNKIKWIYLITTNKKRSAKVHFLTADQ